MIEFLSPVSKNVIAHREILPVGTLGKKIELHQTKGNLPGLEKVRMAIIGIQENRRDEDYLGDVLNFDEL